MEMQEIQMLNSSVKLLNSVGSSSTDVSSVFNYDRFGHRWGGWVGYLGQWLAVRWFAHRWRTNSFIPSYYNRAKQQRYFELHRRQPQNLFGLNMLPD